MTADVWAWAPVGNGNPAATIGKTQLRPRLRTLTTTLAAINSGQLNDQIMSRLLPSLRGVHMPRVDLGRFAFNTGGLVPPAAGGKSSAGFQVVPAVVASESNMASLLAGGQNAMLSFFEKNRDTLRNMLGVTE